MAKDGQPAQGRKLTLRPLSEREVLAALLETPPPMKEDAKSRGSHREPKDSPRKDNPQ